MFAAFGVFAGSPLGRYVLAGLAVVVLLASIYGAGQHKGASNVRRAVATREVAAKADIAAHEAKASKISSDASGELEKAKASVQIRYRTLVQRIPQEIPEGADRDCVVSPAFVNLWNAGVQP